jgi:hypothetical protein
MLGSGGWCGWSLSAADFDFDDEEEGGILLRDQLLTELKVSRECVLLAAAGR